MESRSGLRPTTFTALGVLRFAALARYAPQGGVFLGFTMAGLIYGVGINDADYAVKPWVDGVRKCCPFYRKWYNMLKRCYSPVYHKKQPTYVGCSVAPVWHRFSAFREWMDTQDWQGKELDKDLLGNGKVYSPGTCVFVSQALNTFMTDNKAIRGDCPIGVSRLRFRFQSSINIKGRQTFLGLFDTEEEAHSAWATKKAELAFQYATEQTDQRIADALRSFGEGLLWAEY